MREQIDLNGIWKFQPVPHGKGADAGYAAPEYDDGSWRKATVPSTFGSCIPDLEFYEGSAWFRRSITIPGSWLGRLVMLRFQGVNQHAEVWVNGHAAGRHEDGFLCFEMPIHDHVRYGAENTLAVRVDNTRLPDDVPGMERGWRTCGGILRDVALVAVEKTRIAGMRIVAEPRGNEGKFSLDVRVANESAEPIEATVSAEILDDKMNARATLADVPIKLDVGEERQTFMTATLPDVKPWSPDSPTLYSARVVLRQGDRTRDEQLCRFGFRKIETRGEDLLLNGKPIFLTGFNRHEDSPEKGMAKNLGTARRDFGEMKRAGSNFVRLCHYPHDPGELDLCDEMGLLVMGEIPLYFWRGNADGREVCARKLESAKRQLRKMISRDINHPSIIFWSVSNETDEEREEVAKGNAELVELAQKSDPSRPAMHASNRGPEQASFDADDVICLNYYPSWENRGRNLARDSSEAAKLWEERLNGFRARYPGKPILVTEFGHPSIEGCLGGALGEDIQERAIQTEFEALKSSRVIGAVVWCYADHPWPGGENFMRYVTTSPYGVRTRERRKLKAFDTVARLFRERQGMTAAAGDGHADSRSAGAAVGMIRPDMKNVPDVPFPDGFGIRAMRPGDEALWTDVERDADEYIAIGDDLFKSEFGNDPAVIGERCFLVVNKKGCAVGTISAWYSDDFRGQNYGRIHWVAIRPAYQGLGLGKAALSFALRQLAKWHERCWLLTNAARITAIRMYLDFGFIPDMERDGAADGWREARARLRHPTLERIIDVDGN